MAMPGSNKKKLKVKRTKTKKRGPKDKPIKKKER
jgi:hypothetical protein